MYITFWKPSAKTLKNCLKKKDNSTNISRLYYPKHTLRRQSPSSEKIAKCE